MRTPRHGTRSFRLVEVIVAASAVGIGACAAPGDEAAVAAADETTLFVRVEEGVSDGGPSRGVAWGDADADGFPDLAVANAGGWPQWIYRNEGDGSFSRETEGWAVWSGGWTEGVRWVDYDGDGDLDLHLTEWGAPEHPLRPGARYRPTSLFENLGPGEDGALRLVPIDAGDLTADPVPSSQACWADYDGDGDLDAFVVVRDGLDDALYENRGEGTFRRLPQGPWVGRGGEGRTCAAGDADGDRLAEIYVGNFAGEENVLYRNLGGLTFEVAPIASPAEGGGRTYGASWVDFDDDGDLDLFVTNISTRDRNLLYENDGSGAFALREDLAVVTDSRGPSKGHTWGDFDNDGDLDLYVANGTMGTEDVPDFGLENFLYLNRGDGTFDRVGDDPTVIDAHVSAGVAWADYDRDGDLDLYVANWGDGGQDDDLYRNTTSETTVRHWIEFRLEGTRSNRTGIGAEIQVLAEIEGRPRRQTRWLLDGTGYASQNEPVVHFGLGDAVRADSVIVRWPSGSVDRFADVEADAAWTVREGGGVGAERSASRPRARGRPSP